MLREHINGFIDVGASSPGEGDVDVSEPGEENEDEDVLWHAVHEPRSVEHRPQDPCRGLQPDVVRLHT